MFDPSPNAHLSPARASSVFAGKSLELLNKLKDPEEVILSSMLTLQHFITAFSYFAMMNRKKAEETHDAQMMMEAAQLAAVTSSCSSSYAELLNSETGKKVLETFKLSQ